MASFWGTSLEGRRELSQTHSTCRAWRRELASLLMPKGVCNRSPAQEGGLLAHTSLYHEANLTPVVELGGAQETPCTETTSLQPGQRPSDMSNDQRLLQTHACAVQVKPNPFKCGAVAHSDWACPLAGVLG